MPVGLEGAEALDKVSRRALRGEAAEPAGALEGCRIAGGPPLLQPQLQGLGLGAFPCLFSTPFKLRQARPLAPTAAERGLQSLHKLRREGRPFRPSTEQPPHALAQGGRGDGRDAVADLPQALEDVGQELLELPPVHGGSGPGAVRVEEHVAQKVKACGELPRSHPGFSPAYRAADGVRNRLRGRGVVQAEDHCLEDRPAIERQVLRDEPLEGHGVLI
mmetsp:Transcript_130063/g.362365  ORF Transcript_130063/g.362365 Transcript_130063/m.362365 type:complete len:218 (-) Transcript_130063:97-750(-)